MTPTERTQLGNVEELARGTIGFGGIKYETAVETDDSRDHFGQLGDGQILSGADVDVLVIGPVFDQKDRGVGQIVDMQKLTARCPGAPDLDRL